MNPRGGPYGQWPARTRNGPAAGRYLPTAGTFSDSTQPIGYPVQTPGQPPDHFLPPQHYDGSPAVPISDAEFAQAHADYSVAPFQESLNAPFYASEPVVHEGFVPAPGREHDDDLIPDPYDKRGYDDFETSSEEEDSEEERITFEAMLTHDREEDEDFSLSEDELEENPEDMVIVDPDLSDEEPLPKRGKPKTRGTRGGRRGRPPSGGRGSSRTASRRPRKPGTKGRPKGQARPRTVADPGPEFKELQRLANEAYLREEYETAMGYAEQAIQLNPEIFSAHSILSEIHAAMGDEQASIWSLILGAPTARDKDLWYLILSRIERIDPEKYPDMTRYRKLKLSVMCLTSIINLNSDDWDARFQKLELEAQLHRYSSCVILCRKMLKIKPHDAEILSRMAQLGTANAKQTRIHLSNIIESFDLSINHYIHNPSESKLDWSLLNVYLDLLDKAGDYNYALSRLKTLSRWIQKRQAETYWDELDDDREFDIEDVPRRIAVSEFISQTKKRRGNYGKTLPLEIRVKMGLFRLRSIPPDFDEAIRHLNMLEPEDESEGALLWEFTDLFGIVANTLYTTGHYEHALRFFEPLYRNDIAQTLESYIGMYTCHQRLGNIEDAENILPTLKNWKDATLEDMAILAKFFEDQGMINDAMQRAEVLFKNRASWRLRKIGFHQYDELRKHFFKVRKQARGKHVARKTRVKKYMRKLKAATRNEVESDKEEKTDERPSLGPLRDRPKEGLFRTKEQLPEKKPETFMPLDEPKTLGGTNVPLTAIDHRIFRNKLEDLATNHADELETARAQHREITASFARLAVLSGDVDSGDQSASMEYMSIARELIELFSTFDIFYSDRRQTFRGYFRRLGTGDLWKDSALMILAVEANRIEDGEEGTDLKEKPDTVPEDFFGVHFKMWAELFCRYALLLARQGAEDRCFNVLDVALQSNVFYKSQAYTSDIELCRLACALAVDDSRQVSAAIRYLLKAYPFGTEIFRLYSAANRLCSIADGYATGPANKVVMRWIKTIDYALLGPENRAWWNFKGDDRTQWMQQTLNAGLLDHVKGHDPALFALFGYILMCAGSYTAALNYFFRAYAITPEDPVLNLSIGVAYFQHALKRLSENRQYQIQQGIAFVTRYHELKTKDKVPTHEQEAEFNVGRVYHGLGLVAQAIPYYQRCIALGERVRQDARTGGREDGVEDFASEAAYALQHIYMLSGDFEGALAVTLSNLVIE